MRTRIAVMCAVVLALVVACGAPRSGGFSQIDEHDIPPALSATTSTTTSTIPKTTTTIEAAVETTTTVFVPPTTIASELVRLYYVVGADKIVPIDAPLARDPPLIQVMAALQSAPTGDASLALRTALPPGEQPNPSDDGRGLATIDISPTFLGAAGVDQRLAIAQIVLTFTHLSGISQVKFTMNGEPVAVQLADGTLSSPDTPLFGQDYESLLDSSTPAPQPTTTTTVAGAPTSSDAGAVEQPTTLPG